MTPAFQGPFKFLHTADLHLDSPLLNLDRYDGAPTEVFRSATRRALDNICDLAIAQEVRFVLIAGDLYDGDCRDFNTPLHFRRKMEELRGHGIRVFICQGNHDAQSSMRKAFQLQQPDNVHLFSTERPETVLIDDLKVAIHGQGFSHRAVEDDLSEDYPSPVEGWLNIGLLHTSCGVYEAHDRYAPSSVAGLTRRGYQYWALGHIHKRENLAGPDPWIIYPGNPQGRHVRESGPRGCMLGTFDDSRITVDWHAVDVLRWETATVDASRCEEADQVILEFHDSIGKLLEQAEGRPLAARVEIVGASQAHRELTRHLDHWDRRLRDEAVDRFDDRVWIEKIEFRTRPADTFAAEDDDGPVGELIAGIRDQRAGIAALAEIRDDLEQFLKQLPTDPRVTPDFANLDDLQIVSGLLRDAQDLITSGLFEPGADA